MQHNQINALNGFRHMSQGTLAKANTRATSIDRLKRGIWIYFFLLIFEGALRKWVFPGLATPLLVIRDPLSIWLLYIAWDRNLLPSTFLLTGMFFISIISVFTALVFGHGNIYVALYGARILLISYPLIFVIGRVFTRADILKVGEAMLWMAVPMIVLITIQFYSPQSAWVNRGVGGDESGAGFSGALGFYRPPGTFSFTSGTTTFFSLAELFVIYFWATPVKVNRLLLIAATVAIVLAIPFSMSRSYLFTLVITLVFFVIASLRKPQFFGRMILSAILILLVGLLIVPTTPFQTITAPFIARYTGANETEGGLKGVIGDRLLGGMANEIGRAFDESFFGFGVGAGTNVGAVLLSGKRTFLFSENEFGRVLGELGPILGFAVLLIRLYIVVKILKWAWYKMQRGDILPWILFSVGAISVAYGQWAQPTNLGFSVILGGLMLASLKLYPENA